MRILVAGASGKLGQAVVAELSGRHEIIAAGRTTGEKVDITDLHQGLTSRYCLEQLC